MVLKFPCTGLFCLFAAWFIRRCLYHLVTLQIIWRVSSLWRNLEFSASRESTYLSGRRLKRRAQFFCVATKTEDEDDPPHFSVQKKRLRYAIYVKRTLPMSNASVCFLGWCIRLPHASPTLQCHDGVKFSSWHTVQWISEPAVGI